MIDDWDFEAIETAARRRALWVAARAVERRINADTSDHAGPTAPCACGQAARYAGRRAKTVESVLGPLTLARAYYYRAACEAGFCPRDHVLGLQGGSLSPGVLRMVGQVGAMVSFEEGHELLVELAGVDVPTTHVERAAEALGREVAEDERRVVEPPAPDQPVAPTLYLGMDGTGVPVRTEEVVDRAGKQPDGSAKTREVKLVTVWSAEGRDEEGTPVRDAGSISYSAAIESAATRDTDAQPAEFVQRVVREATRRGSNRPVAAWSWGTARSGSGTSPMNTSPGPLRSSTSTTPRGTCGMWPRPSTAPGATWQHSGPRRGAMNWTWARSTISSQRCASMSTPTTRRGSVSTTSPATATACATPRFAPRACASDRASSRPAARPRSEYAARERRCIGRWQAPTRSSPCAAASSVAASRISGSAAQPPARRPDDFISQI